MAERTSTDRKIHLGLVMNPYGHHMGAWRLPEAAAHTAFEFAHYIPAAHTAERGLFDLLFLADSLGVPPSAIPEDVGRAPLISVLEPMTLMSALSVVTKHIGVAGTITTTYTHPYLVARVLSSLDHISQGRAGWNLVTSGNPNEAFAFGYPEHPPPDQRYRRAREFVDVVCQLWDSWTDDAFIYDKQKGQYFDPEAMLPLKHQGEFFKVSGPLNLPRSPQGRPLISEAGQSEDGMNLAAATADLVFTMQPTLQGAQKFYREIKTRAAALGRRPQEVFVLPGISPYIGRTESEAKAKLQRLDEAFDIRVGIQTLTLYLGVDMSMYPLDKPLPKDLPASKNRSSRGGMIIEMGAREGLTVRQLAIKTTTYGHWQICGTPEMIADALERYFKEGAADGFMILPGLQPESLEDFVDHVVPELQRRGLFRTAYEGKTLRDNFGLSRHSIP